MSYSVIQVVQRNKFISNFVLVAPWLRNLPTTGSQLKRAEGGKGRLVFFSSQIFVEDIFALFSASRKSP